ncbi:hypothetical protein [Sphingosinicella rhizophila]|uniref:Secreted protein n=1 Tax=Sphingosinicella rhizophila TaxID=3050082 RepID=A0ABU3Q429_9SPHN|nr:hypothetical protein [Sphingosinicella sp. GR2756]MDT9598170.1 hypothetical protein [Sphingosinicella sp. GR2756]
MKAFLPPLLVVAAFAAPAFAQEPVDGAKVNQLIVYGDDPCPQSTDAEIIVCARKPEGERFRIPENLREDPNAPVNQSWINRAEQLEYVGRSGIGSCSTVGQGGMIGCFNDIVRAARAERATRDQVNWNQLIEEARQERLGRIDAQSEAIEEDLRNP